MNEVSTNAEGKDVSQRPLLEVKDVAVHFGGIVALDGVSFDVPEGAILGLIGPYIAPHDPLALSFKVELPPSLEHPFGTDFVGRDMLSRVLHATSLSLRISMTVVFLSSLFGYYQLSLSQVKPHNPIFVILQIHLVQQPQ